jgi:uncharacterized membrane protein
MKPSGAPARISLISQPTTHQRKYDMNKKLVLTASVLAGILSMAAQTARAEHDHDNKMMKEPAATEKCYGIARTGKNDCGTKAHSCAGHAAADGMKDEWLMVPVGLCDKLVGGSLTEMAAPAAEEKPAAMPAEPAKP